MCVFFYEPSENRDLECNLMYEKLILPFLIILMKRLFLLSYIWHFPGGFYFTFRVDLCHQADDEDEEDEGSFHEALLEKTFSKRNSLETDSHRNCFPLRFVNIGSRQRIVILVLPQFKVFCSMSTHIWYKI